MPLSFWSIQPEASHLSDAQRRQNTSNSENVASFTLSLAFVPPICRFHGYTLKGASVLLFRNGLHVKQSAARHRLPSWHAGGVWRGPLHVCDLRPPCTNNIGGGTELTFNRLLPLFLLMMMLLLLVLLLLFLLPPLNKCFPGEIMPSFVPETRRFPG